MRGGHRIGAGRPGRDVKVEDCLRLSVSCLKKHGVLGTSWTGQWAWPSSQPDKAQSMIQMTITTDAVLLSFTSHGRSVRQVLVLGHVPNTYGGVRTYLTCPKCRSRRREVYFLDGFAMGFLIDRSPRGS